MVSYHPAKFGGNRHSHSGDIMVLACHMISQDHLIKASCDFISRSPSRQVIVLPSLVVISTVVEEIKWFLVFHVIKGSCDLMDRNGHQGEFPPY